ncbi:hypothetical protein OOK58_43280 [Streptomyces sp. NBC_01728]|uniref:hypothetical protein n=1 Tax=unclassified Streptomyces TaxID=2593676 RepID=UPI002254F000|nr:MULTISPECIES: hypothetical protein [unclassified Streptomyces]MCX4458735.1 hypothetical protein [Streptomyces sp. NBC_01719]MCX4498092.1 hypothetical protein [Streptomyces sp. NBC_01728]
MAEVVHIALDGDAVAVCGAPMGRGAPRADGPEQATCQECIEGWAAAQEGLPRGFPSMPAYPPSSRRPTAVRYVAMGAVAALAVAGIAYWATSSEGDGGGGGGNSNIAVTVVDCSQTVLYEGGRAMLPARVAQIQFVNEADRAENFAAQVDGVTLQGQDGNPARYTLAPHDSKVIGFPMNPTKYGNSEGACYALNVRAATGALPGANNATNAPSTGSPTGDTSDPAAGPDATPTPEDTAAEASQSAVAALQAQALARTYPVGDYTVNFTTSGYDSSSQQIEVGGTVISHSSDTGTAKQFGLVVTLLRANGSVDASGTQCVELTGGTSDGVDITTDGGTPDWASIRVTRSSTTPCESVQ